MVGDLNPFSYTALVWQVQLCNLSIPRKFLTEGLILVNLPIVTLLRYWSLPLIRSYAS